MNIDRLKQLENMLLEQGDDPFLRYGIAMEYFGSNPEESINLLKSLIKDHPDYLASYYPLATALDDADEIEAAVEYLRQGLALAKKEGNKKAERELSQYLENLLLELD